VPEATFSPASTPFDEPFVAWVALALGVDCSAFADPDLEIPGAVAARPVGRPKKAKDVDAGKKPKKKK
jgi:hypothetical protein